MLAGLLPACSNRQRLNPFDPGNPVTGGHPVGFQSRAGNALVMLDWSDTPTSDLLGYRLLRRVQGETEFKVLVNLLPRGTRNHRDTGLINGQLMTYRLHYVFERGLSPLYAEDSATPGTLVPWVADFDGGYVLALTPDGRHIARTVTGFDSPAGIALDPRDGSIWVTDPFAASVTKFNPVTGTRRVETNLSRPSGIAVDPVDGSAWVTDELRQDVAHFAAAGGAAAPGAIGPITLPTGVAVDPRDRAVWVCGNGAAELKLFSPDGGLRWTRSMQRPSRVAVDSTTGDAWVTSFERGVAVRVNPAGTALDTVGGFAGPIGVAVDHRRGLIWVADAVGGELRCFDRAGTPKVRISNLDEVREVAVDLATGNAWATIRGRGEVLVVSPTGAVVARVTGMTGPFGVVLDSR